MATAYQYRPVRFFVFTLLLTWIPWFIAIRLAAQGGAGPAASLLPLAGLLAPLVVGLAMILGSGSQPLKRDFRNRLVDLKRLRPGDLLIAVALPPVVILLSIGLSLALGESRDQLSPSSSEGLLGMVILALILAPIIEETGWRGYGVDSLRARWGTLHATLLFGVLWSLWHAPLVLIPGTYQHELAQVENRLFLVNFFVSTIPAALLANWLFYRNGRSILVGMLFHAALNAAAVLINAGQVAKTIATLVFAVIAVAVALTDRQVFGAGPRNFVDQPEVLRQGAP